jgi:predicted aconitase with swiveling domain
MSDSENTVPVTGLLPGQALGSVLKLTEPLNAWGGLDPDTGTIIHHSHPQRGSCIAGRILVMPESRGSGTNAQVFAQAWATGHGPLAVVLAAADYVLCVGAVVSRELYDVDCPVVVAARSDYDALHNGDVLRVIATEYASSIQLLTAPERWSW